MDLPVKESNETGESGLLRLNPKRSRSIGPRRWPRLPHPEPSTPAYSGKGGWYKDTVTVSFTANGDPNLADGSPGSGVEPSSLTSPETFNTSGSFKDCGTVADKVGNVSEKTCVTVQVDATPPTLEITCPATAVLGESASATVKAKDEQSGLAQDPSGSVPIDTSKTGDFTVTRTAIDNVGHETTKSCTTEVVYPVPGAPQLSGPNPNNGNFTLTWTGPEPATHMGLSYTLEQRLITSPTWTTVATGIEKLSYEFPKSAKESEGTWLYRVQAVDSVNLKETEFSPESVAVVVGLPPELGHCVSAPTKQGPHKLEGTGAFTKNSCASLSKKHNGLYNWEGGVTKGGFSSLQDVAHTTFASAKKGGLIVTCTGAEVANGEWVSARRAENLTLKLTSCSSVVGPCTSAGALSETIDTKTLEGVLGVYKKGSKASANKAGLEVYPDHKSGPFAEFTCGSKAVTVRGALVFTMRANKVEPHLVLTAKAAKGVQKPEGLVEEPKAVLEMSVASEPYEAVGLNTTVPLEGEEPLELNTVA